MEYTECGSLCPQTCERLFGTEEDLLLCPTVCVPGCFCRNDLVLHNGQCIQPSQCPSEHKYYIGFAFSFLSCSLVQNLLIMLFKVYYTH